MHVEGLHPSADGHRTVDLLRDGRVGIKGMAAVPGMAKPPQGAKIRWGCRLLLLPPPPPLLLLLAPHSASRQRRGMQLGGWSFP